LADKVTGAGLASSSWIVVCAIPKLDRIVDWSEPRTRAWSEPRATVAWQLMA
jgi:hypothetical protein